MGATLDMTPDLIDYLRRVGVREHPVLRKCREETQGDENLLAAMQISPEQGAFLQLWVQATGARRILEIGVFTGYSSLAMALVLPAGGEIVALDISEDYTRRARAYWAQAGVADRIDLRVAPALDSLDALRAAGAADSFDFCFIDADKTGYDSYYERALKLVRPGGVIAFDNALWGGAVIDPADQSPDTEALRALNEKLAQDARVDIALTTIGDGLFFARRR